VKLGQLEQHLDLFNNKALLRFIIAHFFLPKKKKEQKEVLIS